jgi:hypothetical protein
LPAKPRDPGTDTPTGLKFDPKAPRGHSPQTTRRTRVTPRHPAYPEYLEPGRPIGFLR